MVNTSHTLLEGTRQFSSLLYWGDICLITHVPLPALRELSNCSEVDVLFQISREEAKLAAAILQYKYCFRHVAFQVCLGSVLSLVRPPTTSSLPAPTMPTPKRKRAAEAETDSALAEAPKAVKKSKTSKEGMFSFTVASARVSEENACLRHQFTSAYRLVPTNVIAL